MYLALSTATVCVVPFGAGTVTFCTGTSTAFRRDTFTRLRVFHDAFTANPPSDGYGRIGTGENGSRISSQSQQFLTNSGGAVKET